jgi:hypothetical protein
MRRDTNDGVCIVERVERYRQNMTPVHPNFGFRS